MGPLSAIRHRLGRKLFLTYLIIIAVGGVVLVTAAGLVVPVAFERHLAAMAAHLGDAPELVDDLYAQFRQAMNESVLAAAAASTLLAVGLGFYFSRRIVAPIEEMTRASGRIAEGHYGERVGTQILPRSDGGDELEQLAASFNRMAASLEHSEGMRRQLIGDVAHELRTPLTSIVGYMEGLIDGVVPADPATFERVRREADRLQRLVHDLQELSRIDEGAVRLDPRPTSVRGLVETAVECLQPQFEGREIDVVLDVPEDLPPVAVDPDRMGQVLLNLLGNALRYTPEGGRVTVAARRDARAVRIAVADTGIGIAPEHLPHLFDRFYRVDPSRSRAAGGTGIGLTIARRLVELHGGSIAAESEGPGKGATFTISLPAPSPGAHRPPHD